MIDLNRYYIAKTYEGVSGNYAGRPGFVPQATTGDTGKFLSADGSWASIDISNFYTKDNPSGFITGVDLSNYATTGQLNQASGDLQGQINLLNVNNSIAFAIALG
jgi:hypothetical protein